MATRPAWKIKDNKIICKEFEFEWNGGFAIKQKQKNIENLHASIFMDTKKNALEVSSKGSNGVQGATSGIKKQVV